MAVPQQRGGTVYGAGPHDVIDMTVPVSMNAAVENSGSLTGHILAQGWRDEVVDRRRNNLKVAVAMLVVLGLLVTVSLVSIRPTRGTQSRGPAVTSATAVATAWPSLATL